MPAQAGPPRPRRVYHVGEMDHWQRLADELTMTLNYAALAAREVGRDHPASADLRRLQHSALRCAAITRDAIARSFSR